MGQGHCQQRLHHHLPGERLLLANTFILLLPSCVAQHFYLWTGTTFWWYPCFTSVFAEPREIMVHDWFYAADRVLLVKSATTMSAMSRSGNPTTTPNHQETLTSSTCIDIVEFARTFEEGACVNVTPGACFWEVYATVLLVGHGNTAQSSAQRGNRYYSNCCSS